MGRITIPAKISAVTPLIPAFFHLGFLSEFFFILTKLHQNLQANQIYVDGFDILKQLPINVTD